jgi:peptide/histidine transporter 3/4
MLRVGFECLESTGFFGICTTLVVYLEKVLHGSNLASASKVTMWTGTSYLTPIFGAIIADTFLGNYNTILISLVIYLLVSCNSFILIHGSRIDQSRKCCQRILWDLQGMMFVTFSVFPTNGCGARWLLGVRRAGHCVHQAVPRRDRERRGAFLAAA